MATHLRRECWLVTPRPPLIYLRLPPFLQYSGLASGLLDASRKLPEGRQTLMGHPHLQDAAPLVAILQSLRGMP